MTVRGFVGSAVPFACRGMWRVFVGCGLRRGVFVTVARTWVHPFFGGGPLSCGVARVLWTHEKFAMRSRVALDPTMGGSPWPILLGRFLFCCCLGAPQSRHGGGVRVGAMLAYPPLCRGCGEKSGGTTAWMRHLHETFSSQRSTR